MTGIGNTQDDRRHRATKIICTIGTKRNSPKDIKELMQAGMDVVRLNMDYYDIDQMEQILESVKAASEELATSCPIFIDLKGMLITTLSNNEPI